MHLVNTWLVFFLCPPRLPRAQRALYGLFWGSFSLVSKSLGASEGLSWALLSIPVVRWYVRCLQSGSDPHV